MRLHVDNMLMASLIIPSSGTRSARRPDEITMRLHVDNMLMASLIIPSSGTRSARRSTSKSGWPTRPSTLSGSGGALRTTPRMASRRMPTPPSGSALSAARMTPRTRRSLRLARLTSLACSSTTPRTCSACARSTFRIIFAWASRCRPSARADENCSRGTPAPAAL
jgi:hypothetical protein